MVKGLGGRSSKDKANDRKNDKKKRWGDHKKDKANDRKNDSDDDEEMDCFTELSRRRYGKNVCNVWWACPTCGGWHTNSQTWTWKNTPLGRVQVCELCAPLF